MKLEFSRHISKKILKYQISWKSVHWEMCRRIRTDRWTDRHDEASRRFSNLVNAPKNLTFFPRSVIYVLLLPSPIFLSPLNGRTVFSVTFELNLYMKCGLI